MVSLNVLTTEQRESITKALKRYDLDDYAREVELVIMGELTGVELIRLINVLCQRSYLIGYDDAKKQLNGVLKSLANGGELIHVNDRH